MVKRITTDIWKVAATPALDANKQGQTQPQHGRSLFDPVIGGNMNSEQTTAWISAEAELVLAAEKAGATITWDPPHPAIVHYLAIGPKR